MWDARMTVRAPPQDWSWVGSPDSGLFGEVDRRQLSHQPATFLGDGGDSGMGWTTMATMTVHGASGRDPLLSMNGLAVERPSAQPPVGHQPADGMQVSAVGVLLKLGRKLW